MTYVTRAFAGLTLLLSLGLTALPSGAAGLDKRRVIQQKITGGYRLVLQIGPAEGMNMGGSEMATGPHATCSMPGMLSLESRAGTNLQSRICNHHVELHVYTARTGKVVMHARVSILMRNITGHTAITVPVAGMMAPTNTRDYHYGNNTYAVAGRYTVTVRVNRTTTLFNVGLR